MRPDEIPQNDWRAIARTAGQRRRLLHVGCGPAEARKINPIFRGPAWHEIRVDIDPGVQPDIVATIADLSPVPDNAVDAVWSSHNLEHLYDHEVAPALSEFRRVLRAGGVLLVTVPDVKTVAAFIAQYDLDEPLFRTSKGELTPLDSLYGWRSQVASGRTYMAHRTGFSAKVLGNAILAAGFPGAQVRRGHFFDLWAIAYKDRGIENRDLIGQAIGAPPRRSPAGQGQP